MKTILGFFSLLLLFPALRAQNDTQSIFALVQKNVTAAKKLPAVDSAKYNRALRVYENLVKAGGKTRVPAPKFVMNRNERYMVWLDPKSMEIGLELKDVYKRQRQR